MEIKQVNTIDSSELDALIVKTYGRPYCFQQQDGCQPRGSLAITVPSDCHFDFENESIPEEINGSEVGVSFVAWLARDPAQAVDEEIAGAFTRMFWHRNFHPCQDMVLDDLHNKGLLPAGEYQLTIDW